MFYRISDLSFFIFIGVATLLFPTNSWAKEPIHLKNCSDPALSDTGYSENEQHGFEGRSYNLSDHIRLAAYDRKLMIPGAWHTLSCHSDSGCQIQVTNGYHTIKEKKVYRGKHIWVCQSLISTELHHDFSECPSECFEDPK